VVSDVDSLSITVMLTLSDSAAGSLSTATSGSVTSTYNAAAGVWTASGAIADVNVLLAGVTFTPSVNYNSNFTIATSVDDGVAPAITGVKNMTGTAQNDAPVLTSNALTIAEGGSVILSSANLSASDVDNAASSLTFNMSGVTGGEFELVSNPGVGITSFTQAQVTAGEVRFVHDGGEAAPGYDVTVSDGRLSDGRAAPNITFTNVNDAPVLMNNRLIVIQGASVLLTSANLSATDADTAAFTLRFTVSGVSGGQFELVSNPGVAITSFTQAQVTGGTVRFAQDGGTTTPSYDVTVSDGSLSAGPAAATITFVTSDNTAELVRPPVPVLPQPLPTPETVLGQGTQPPAVNFIPTGSSGTGVGGTEKSVTSTLGPDNFADEFQFPNNSTDSQESANTSRPLPSRPADKAPADIREGISIRSDAPLTTQDPTLDESVASTLTSGDLSSVVDVHSFVQELDKVRDEVAEEAYLEKVVVGSSITVTTGLSIGYVLWLVRGEVLLTSLLASLPAWRLIDPLPVLSFLGKRSEEDEEDDSIEAAVKKSGEATQSAPAPRQQGGTRSIKWRMVMQPTDSIPENSL
jgi:Cadherin-like